MKNSVSQSYRHISIAMCGHAAVSSDTKSSHRRQEPRMALAAHLATHLAVVLEGLASPQVAGVWHAWGGGVPEDQVSWSGLLEAGEGQTELWG